MLLQAAIGPALDEGLRHQDVQMLPSFGFTAPPDGRRGRGVEIRFLCHAPQRPEPALELRGHRFIAVAECCFHPALTIGLVHERQIAETSAFLDHLLDLADAVSPLILSPLDQIPQRHAQGEGMPAHRFNQPALLLPWHVGQDAVHAGQRVVVAEHVQGQRRAKLICHSRLPRGDQQVTRGGQCLPQRVQEEPDTQTSSATSKSGPCPVSSARTTSGENCACASRVWTWASAR